MIDKIKENYLDILLIFLLALSIAVTVIYSVFKPIPVLMIVLLQVSGLIGILFLKYTVQIGRFSNRIFSLLYRKNGNSSDDEPSTLNIALGKAMGYLMIAIQIGFLFFL